MKPTARCTFTLSFLAAALALAVLLPQQSSGQPALTLRIPSLFPQGLEPVASNSVAVAEGELLRVATAQATPRERVETAALLESFLAERPDSPWAPGIRANLAGYYGEQEGAFTRALQHWESAWEATKSYTGGPGKRIADYVLAHWL